MHNLYHCKQTAKENNPNPVPAAAQPSLIDPSENYAKYFIVSDWHCPKKQIDTIKVNIQQSHNLTTVCR